MTLPAGSYTVAVGAGGAGANRLGSHPPSNGLPSVISAAVGVIGTAGGGRGNSEIFYDARDRATSGASGGGENQGAGSGASAAGIGDLGNDGGGGSQDWPGGGGGAGAAGGTGGNPVQGAGGAGTNLTFFSGVPVEYARGGDGCPGRINTDGANAVANTGNGGTGGSSDSTPGGISIKGGNGGSGIVIVRYEVVPPPSGALILLW